MDCFKVLKEMCSEADDGLKKILDDGYSFGDPFLLCIGEKKNYLISLRANQKHWDVVMNILRTTDGEWFQGVKDWFIKPVEKTRAKELADMAMFKANKR